jgi:hypothetical protein
MRTLYMSAPTLAAAAAVVAQVNCLEANLAHTAEPGVDSLTPLDYLSSTRSLFSINV